MTLRVGEATLTEYLIAEQRKVAAATGNYTALVNDIRLACTRIAFLVGKGALTGTPGRAGSDAAAGERAELDLRARDTFIRATQWGGSLAGMVAEGLAEPYPIPDEYTRGHYLLAFDPLVGSANFDVNAPVGSIFSVLPAPVDEAAAEEGAVRADAPAFLQPGSSQVCAGYAIYGPSTMLVLTLGHGVNGFTYDRDLGEFILTHPELRIPEQSSEFAIDSSNARYWEPAVARYVSEGLAGRTGRRERDFSMRWASSLVVEAHRVLMRGGLFLCPRDTREDGRQGRLRLLYEANPIGLLVEQAGGRASTGFGPVLAVQPRDIHERTGFIFGARAEVDRLERYHRDHNEVPHDAPLFRSRGLFLDNS